MSRRAVALTTTVLALIAGCAQDPVVQEQPSSPVTVIPPIVSTVASTTTTTSRPPSTTTTSTAPTTTTTLRPLTALGLEVVAEGLDQPIIAVSPPGDERLFVVERRGVIRIVGSDEPFLDIDDRVGSESGIEPGLLGLAFHPDYSTNGRFFVFYYRSDADRTRLAEFRASIDDPDRADRDSERELIGFDKPTNRHNGGMVMFGPDGRLWVSLGEGGRASVHSQDPNTLLSSILRIDVDGGDPYAVPGDNPFAGGGGAPEVWAYGLRNPWRFAIDPVERLLYVADVGHEEIEEIDVVPIDGGGGFNFGWIRMEGSRCFQRGCDPVAERLTLPVLEYGHDQGCSVTGGFVYRGVAIPELVGHYLYSDWCGGWLRSFRFGAGEVVDSREWLTGIGQVNGFGRDSAGELYLLTWEGDVLRLVPVREP